MGIVTVSRGSYSSGKAIAETVAQRLRYDCISREIILDASKEFNIPELKLTQVFEDPPSILDRFKQGKKKYIAFTRAALLDYLAKDNIVYHGFAGHLFVQGIPHALKVLITAKMENRIAYVMARDQVSGKEALRFIKRVDDQRKKWGKKLYGIDPWDSRLYDLVLHIEKITEQDAVDIICRAAGLKQFQTSPASKRALEDLLLKVKVENLLMDVKPPAEVSVENRFVYLKPEMPLSQEAGLVGKMGEIMKTIPEVKGIKVISAKDADDSYPHDTKSTAKSVKDTTPTFVSDL